MNIFEAYGKVSQEEDNPTIINGRYQFQSESEKFISEEIMQKLSLSSSDNLLDIGCGSGDISYKLSKLVNSVTLCDHPSIINRIKRVYKNKKFRYIEQDFLSANLNKQKFEKILSYSVIHCLNTEKEVFEFIDKIISLLKPNGRALIGDIPNKNKLNRFLSSKKGKEFQKEWEIKKQKIGIKQTSIGDYLSKDLKFVEFNDILILKILNHIRKKNYNAYIYDQQSLLPFCNSREDIVIY